jgi:hypothetical protein
MRVGSGCPGNLNLGFSESFIMMMQRSDTVNPKSEI